MTGCVTPSHPFLDFLIWMVELASKQIVKIPAEVVADGAIGNQLIVKDTRLYCIADMTSGGIILPDSNVAGDKTYNVGEVVSVGKDVKEIKVGDCVLYQTARAAGLDEIPNGSENPIFFKIMEPASVCRMLKEHVDIERVAQAQRDAAAATEKEKGPKKQFVVARRDDLTVSVSVSEDGGKTIRYPSDEEVEYIKHLLNS